MLSAVKPVVAEMWGHSGRAAYIRPRDPAGQLNMCEYGVLLAYGATEEDCAAIAALPPLESLRVAQRGCVVSSRRGRVRSSGVEQTASSPGS